MPVYLGAGLYGTGRIMWKGSRDAEGHRTYKVAHRVKTGRTDGPANVLSTPGLPQIGSIWNFGTDSDNWVFCTPLATLTPLPKRKNATAIYWVVEQTFSSNPTLRCQDAQIDDPLLEPQKISGTFVKYIEEATHDRFDNLIQNSALEQIRGKQVEFDSNRPTVRIEQNVPDLELETFSEMVDTVNDASLWGLTTRKIKLSNVAWERKIWGSCNYYYTRVLDFDINFKTFDRIVPDEGTKVLNGHWSKSTGLWVLDDLGGGPPDKTDPTHFIRYKDVNGENTRVFLDGNGEPLIDSANPVTKTIEKYEESNFLVLGIETSF